jgi:hypothetical protein
VVKKWEFPGRMPTHAMPLPDGSMLIGLAGPGEVRKVGADGNITTVFGGMNNAARVAWTTGFAPYRKAGCWFPTIWAVGSSSSMPPGRSFIK